MVLLLTGVLLADSSPCDFVVKMKLYTQNDSTYIYSYYNPYSYYEEYEKVIPITIDSSKNCKQNSNDWCYTSIFPEKIFINELCLFTDNVFTVANVPFAFAISDSIDLSTFDSIVIDSVLWGELSPSFQWFDSSTCDWFLKNNAVSSFHIFISDASSYYEMIRVVSFDSLWTPEYFMSHFQGYNDFVSKSPISDKDYSTESDKNFYRQLYYWDFCRDSLRIELPEPSADDINSFPETIKSALIQQKIFVFPFEAF